MIKLICRTTTIAIALLLAACGGSGGGGISEPAPTGDTIPSTSPSLVAGRSNFESSCAECHGSSGDNIFRPIDKDNCLVADCSNIDALAAYIDEFMPVASPQSCRLGGTDSCAVTTAAYIINDFSTEAPVQPTESPEAPDPTTPAPTSAPADENVQTPLARLSNDEFVNSVRTLLSLPSDSAQINAAKTSLVSESLVKGLPNDSATQTLSHQSIAGYSTMALAAGADFLKDVTSRDELGLALECSTLIENYNPTNQLGACTAAFTSNLITKAYRRPSNDDDVANIAEILNALDANIQQVGIEKFSIEYFKEYVQSILHFVILSPEFLLVIENGSANTANSSGDSKGLTDHEIATRMALFLAGSLPDDALLDAAAAGLLGDTAVRLQHADRLMQSDIGIAQFTSLTSNWLGIVTTDGNAEALNAVNSFLSNWFVNEGNFSDLYQAPVTVEHLSGIETTEPLGVLGLQAFVASHTSFPTPSFITRGAFVVERLLCEALPEDLPDGALDAGELTPLEVFEGHAQQPCATCHRVFDNYGAAFQRFDAETSLYNPGFQDFGGSFDLFDIGDVNASVTGVADLGSSLASSEKASSCMTELWFRHSMRRSIDQQGKDAHELNIIKENWAGSGDTSMKALLRTIVASDSFITLYL